MVHDLQKANMGKRISAYIFDSILLITVAVGVAALLSGLFGYDTHTAERQRLRQDYETRYGISFDVEWDSYEALPEEERQKQEEAYAAFAADPEVGRLDAMIVNLTLLILVFSLLVPYVLLELLVPLKLGNGQTLGKKIFGIGVMRVDGVRLSPFQLVVRTVIGKYTVETMLPLFLILMFMFNVMAFACLLGMTVLVATQGIFTLFSYRHTPIHDMIAGTVAVDFASQRIFDSTEDLLAYQKRLAAEAAERADY